MRFQPTGTRGKAICAGIASMLATIRSVLRGLPLLVANRPQTPLRILCIMAFDTLHRLRGDGPLPSRAVANLAALLDFMADANAALDRKANGRCQCQRALEVLQDAGSRSSLIEYLRRLEHLETRRPSPGGDDSQFSKVRRYREAVVRLSLGMLATTAGADASLDAAIRATHGDGRLNLLFRMAMQCQIIDDVLDYSEDFSAGLPSFLTAGDSLRQGFEFTRLASWTYANTGDLARSSGLFPLELALVLVSACTRLVIVHGRWKHRCHAARQFPPRVSASPLGTTWRECVRQAR